MKIKLFTLSILCLISGMMSCQANPETFSSVEVEAFEQVVADTAVICLDVRHADEYAAGHLAGAINLDVIDDAFEAKAAALLPLGKTIALYCRSGHRSKRAAAILAGKGYKVVELNTGYLGWTNAGKSVEK